jgi:hypothetical protein
MNSLRMSFWMVPRACPGSRPAPRRRRYSRPAPAAPRRSWSSTPRPCPAECHRTGSSCPRRSPPPRRPCRRRRSPADDRSHSRGGWPGRRPPRRPARPPPAPCGRRRWIPRRWRTRRTGGWSRDAGVHGRLRAAHEGLQPGMVSVWASVQGPAVYSGLTSMPSGRVPGPASSWVAHRAACSRALSPVGQGGGLGLVDLGSMS